MHTVDFQNHGGLTFIYRRLGLAVASFRKRTIDCSVAVKTFEFVLLGIYRPGSQPVTAPFFDELSTLFEELMTLRHPVVVCRNFNVHVDQVDNPHVQ